MLPRGISLQLIARAAVGLIRFRVHHLSLEGGGVGQGVEAGHHNALSGDVAQLATVVLTDYFGGRSLEKVARILGRK
jgi:hypothetical protein